ncbi:MAG: hypothetical protein SFY68_06035, partial [Candidatus Sumerlaeia bacterium]|nr:hypothetical protein [Candidatus Sumerlaeia bacterium]
MMTHPPIASPKFNVWKAGQFRCVHNNILGLLFLVVCLFCFLTPLSALEITNLVPAAASPGTEVKVFASNLEPTSTSIRIGTQEPTIAASVQQDHLSFIVPENAQSGILTIIQNSEEIPTGLLLRITRSIQVQYQVPNPEVFATHDIGSTIEDAVSNGAFHSLPVPQGETFLVAATS